MPVATPAARPERTTFWPWGRRVFEAWRVIDGAGGGGGGAADLEAAAAHEGVANAIATSAPAPSASTLLRTAVNSKVFCDALLL